MIDDRLLDRPGTCRTCGRGDYSIRELTLHDGQDFRCYWCFDEALRVNRFRAIALETL